MRYHYFLVLVLLCGCGVERRRTAGLDGSLDGGVEEGGSQPDSASDAAFASDVGTEDAQVDGELLEDAGGGVGGAGGTGGGGGGPVDAGEDAEVLDAGGDVEALDAGEDASDASTDCLETCCGGPFPDVEDWNGRFVEVERAGDAVVLDLKTCLIWQQGTLQKLEWQAAVDYCEALDHAGWGDWRLPKPYFEMWTLVNNTLASPPWTYFPDMPPVTFWTIDVIADNPAVCMDFGPYGPSFVSYFATVKYYVRCVRGG